MPMITNPALIHRYRYMTLLSALGLEIKGIRMIKGVSAYTVIKRELNLKGCKTTVYNDLANMLDKPTINQPKGNTP